MHFIQQCVYVFCNILKINSDYVCINSINRLGFVIEMLCVNCEVKTGFGSIAL